MFFSAYIFLNPFLLMSAWLKIKNAVNMGDKQQGLAGIEYEPIEFNPHITALYDQSYCLTTGIVMRSLKSSKLIGFINQEPVGVLKSLFPQFYITSFEGQFFYSSINTDGLQPMRGIGIEAATPVYGVYGKVDDLLKGDRAFLLRPFRRRTKLRAGDVLDIITHLNEIDQNAFLSPGYHRGVVRTWRTVNMLSQLIPREKKRAK
jgi:hypothetical protein